MAHIQTPVKGFTGKVAGVSFADGVGTTDDPGAIAYFERHGYDVTPNSPPSGEGKDLTPKQKLQAEAKELGLSDEGTADEIKARIAEHKKQAENQPAENPPVPADGEGKDAA